MGRDKTSSVKVVEDSEMTPTLAATSLYNMLNKTLDRSVQVQQNHIYHYAEKW